ncbi:MAG: DUF4192 domain-containing protein [Actinobacteria bacterium]|nr:DUF4192 domain-containing protein [Actinomycetota bacterium]MCB9412757.1 DUF4192 domain-containing protein [Actinomycetota bacterium]
MADTASSRPGRPASPTIRVRSASGLVACAPYLVGFTPHDSVVVVFLTRPPDRQVAVTLRIDLLGDDAKPADRHQVLAHLAESLDRAAGFGVDLDQAHVLVFSEDAAELPGSAVVMGLLEILRERGIAIGEVLATTADRIWSYPTSDAPVSAAGEVIDQSEALGVAFEMVSSGVGFAADRGVLESWLSAGVDDVVSQADLDAARRNRRSACKTSAGAARWRRAMEEAVVAGMASDPPVAPASADAAAWALALADARVREPVMYRLFVEPSPRCRRERLARARSWLCGLAARVTGPDAAPAAATLAAVAWQGGDGAFARIAADHALRADPANRLAALIGAACVSGMPPATWADVLATFSLAELRDDRTEALAG